MSKFHCGSDKCGIDDVYSPEIVVVAVIHVVKSVILE